MKFLSLITAALASLCSIQAQESTATEVKHVNSDQAKALLDKNATEAKEAKIQVVDVRSEDEYKEGHIEGATNIDILSEGFEEKLAKLDKTKPVLVHCAAGGRSTRSLKVFQKLGFKTVTHLDGGLNEWKTKGHPLKK